MFYKSFCTQFNIMIRQIGFQSCFIIVLLFGLTNSAYWLLINYKNPKESLIDVSEAFILNDHSPILDKFFLLSLLLLLLPYCFFNIKNRINKIDLLQIIRINTFSYYTAGSLVSFLGTLIAFFIPLLIELVINQFFFSNTGIMANGFTFYDLNGGGGLMGTTIISSSVINPGFTLIPISLYISHPLLYNTIYAFIFSCFMGIISYMMYTISLYVQKNIYLFFPLYIFYFLLLKVGDVIYIYVHPLFHFNFFQYFRITYNMNLSPHYICLLILFMLLFSSVLLHHKIYIDQGI